MIFFFFFENSDPLNLQNTLDATALLSLQGKRRRMNWRGGEESEGGKKGKEGEREGTVKV